MNPTPFHRRAIRDYDEVRRMAIEAAEREAHVIHESRAISSKSAADIQPPEPCNFCAPDELVPTTGLRAYLAKSLGRWWLLWLIAFSGLCIIFAFLAGALIYLSVHP